MSLNSNIAAKNIEEGFRAYIKTRFSFADKSYADAFDKSLNVEGQLAKGPFIELSNSYQPGRTLQTMMQSGDASTSFATLENCAEREKEIKLERPLYSHQEEAFIKANANRNLVITTGTGSGKTECFLLPILNDLLTEENEGCLNSGVRAIIIYPMNALANDQIKRIRTILKDRTSITFGLYNGNTPHKEEDGYNKYIKSHQNSDGSFSEPLPNEMLSRERMQQEQPHILITNYSMLEYMLLRPNDDKVFYNSQLRFIVLDEAHSYKGAMGIETSMLMRRFIARVAGKKKPQFILTSATLGNPDEDEQIVSFASTLCGVDFASSDIIRSKEIIPEIKEYLDFPLSLFTELANPTKSISEILESYQVDFAPDANEAEKLYELCLRSKLFAAIRQECKVPISLSTLHKNLNQLISITEEEITAAIQVFSKAQKGNDFLLKARYHFFIRTLEGAFATFVHNPQVFLNRISNWNESGDERAVFEIALCSDCGRIAVVGRMEDGYLVQRASQIGDKSEEYYLVKSQEDTTWFEDEDGEEKSVNEQDFVICSKCGAYAGEVRNQQQMPCEHEQTDLFRVHLARKTDSGTAKCPACDFGKISRFYLGNEAATAVLATTLFEELPEYEEKFSAPAKQKDTPSLFGIKPETQKTKVNKARQFLCFSDSRSEAAYFACYLETSYEEFLRRRGIWHVCEKFKEAGKTVVPLKEFAAELSHYFESNDTFVEMDSRDTSGVRSRRNAWVALLNEMYNARRSTGLTWMGRLFFKFKKNNLVVKGLQSGLSKEGYLLGEKDVEALLDLLVQDIVYSGAIDAGREYLLTDPDREYIFFSPYPKKMILNKSASTSKKVSLTGWTLWKRENGKSYPNARIERVRRALGCDEDFADTLLKQYWKDVLNMTSDAKLVLNACDFDIVLVDDLKETPYYICEKCARITPYNCKDQCVSVKCNGKLIPFDVHSHFADNHYTRLYSSPLITPLFVREHTAQLSRDMQQKYQEDFLNKKLNVLSCSTTFEMGVDIGSLEAVYMRNFPPSPSNYVQRAGRAGRSLDATAFVLTFARLSSHDFTYFKNPTNMISGRISAPIFRLRNAKILNRHIYSVALSSFFIAHPDIFDNDNRFIFLNKGGYECFCEFINPPDQSLKNLLKASIPDEMHQKLGISDNTWVEGLISENGLLSTAVNDYRNTLKEMEKMLSRARREHQDVEASRWSTSIKKLRANPEEGTFKQRLIEFLVRSNVLPKYGFPIDTVELITTSSPFTSDGDKSVQLSRDLQLAISEYAPGSEIVADGCLYKSRYIRKDSGRSKAGGWDEGFYAVCPNQQCKQYNYMKHTTVPIDRECISCKEIIKKAYWRPTLEPRKGFYTDQERYSVPMRRPEKKYRTDDFYIGDPTSKVLEKYLFEINGQDCLLESTTNDTLVVIGNTGYYVCPVCGYADEKRLPEEHKNVFGSKCSYKVKDNRLRTKQLAHDFKTDVIKITFMENISPSHDTMLSVLYAMLEGVSQTLGIERNDIKGCLYRVSSLQGMTYSLVLYDAVAGGAGHVRRLVTQDGVQFAKVLEKAYLIVDTCSCDTSCYQCLRNYYNQMIHDQLNRQEARDFLSPLIGGKPILKDLPEDNTSNISIIKEGIDISNDGISVADYPSWKVLADFFGLDNISDTWDNQNIPLQGAEVLTQITVCGISLETLAIWPEYKILILNSDVSSQIADFLVNEGWVVFPANCAPTDLAKILAEG